MRWFTNAKISSKLLVSFVVVATIAGIVGFWGVRNMRAMDELEKDLYEFNTAPFAQLLTMSEGYQRIRVAARDLIIQRDPEKKHVYLDRIHDLRREIAQAQSVYEAALRTDSERRTFQAYRDAERRYDEVVQPIVSLAASGREEEATVAATDAPGA